jgi:hypothetical protein
VRKADNLPPSSADVTESGSLNLPEPSEPRRAVGEYSPLPLYPHDTCVTWRKVKYTGRGKFQPRTSREGPEKNRYTTTPSLTSDLDGRASGQGQTAAILPPRKRRGSYGETQFEYTIKPNSYSLMTVSVQHGISKRPSKLPDQTQAARWLV